MCGDVTAKATCYRAVSAFVAYSCMFDVVYVLLLVVVVLKGLPFPYFCGGSWEHDQIPLPLRVWKGVIITIINILGQLTHGHLIPS